MARIKPPTGRRRPDAVPRWARLLMAALPSTFDVVELDLLEDVAIVVEQVELHLLLGHVDLTPQRRGTREARSR